MNKRFLMTCLILCLAVLSFGCSNQTQERMIEGPRTTADSNSSRDKDFELGNFQKISGTSILVAQIGGSFENGTRLSSSGGSFEINNYVYFNLDEESLTRLLPTDDYVIQNVAGHSKVADAPDEGSDIPDEKPPISWWVYSIVKSDTNADEKLGHGDLFTIGMADVGGQGFTEFFEGVEEILAQEMKNDSELLMIYVQDDRRYLAKINLEQMTLEKNEELFVFESELD